MTNLSDQYDYEYEKSSESGATEDIEEQKTKGNETKTQEIEGIIGYRHIITKYSWFLFISIIAFFVVYIVPYSKINSITSSSKIFNASSDPLFFVHMTDIHVSYMKSTNNENYETALQFAKSLNPDVVLSSGDNVDDYQYLTSKINIATQITEEFEIYKRLNDDNPINATLYLDAAGNHDFFNVYSLDTENNNYITSSVMWRNRTATMNDFIASSYVYQDNVFVVINPYDFPRGRALLDVYLLPSQQVLDIVEEELQEQREQHPNKSIIAITHYPVNQWGKKKSSNGKTFNDMINDYKVSLTLSGHTHPKNYLPQHHNEALEIIGSDLRDNNHIGILTNDNNNLFYHEYSINDKPSFVTTYPIEASQLTKNTMFANNTIDIRVLVFSDNENETITVNGEKLVFQRHIKEGLSLYHLEKVFEEGYHTLVFNATNDSYSYEIFVGEKLNSFWERIGDERELYTYPLYVLIIVYIILFIITFPINIERHFPAVQKYVDSSIDYLYNRKENYTFLHHVANVAQGFLILRWQLLVKSYSVMPILFIVLFVPFFCPTAIQEIEGHWGIVSIYGSTVGGETRPTQFSYLLNLLHTLAVTTPLIFIISVLIHFRKFSYWYLVDLVFYIISAVVCLYITFVSITHATRFVFAITNFPFIIVPIITTIISVSIVLRSRVKVDSESESE